MLGFKSFGTATCILAGVEAMHMIKKEQVDLQSQEIMKIPTGIILYAVNPNN